MSWLLDTEPFLTRSHCGLGWTEPLKAAYMVANLLIATSYFAIPSLLVTLYRSKRQELPNPWILILFASFILLCGLTHLTDILVFWWPPYRFYTLLFVLTAIASTGTALVLPWAVQVVVRLPSREFVHALNDKLQREAADRKVREMELEALIVDLEAKLDEAAARTSRHEFEKDTADWWEGKAAAIAEMHGQLKSMIIGNRDSPHV